MFKQSIIAIFAAIAALLGQHFPNPIEQVTVLSAMLRGPHAFVQMQFEDFQRQQDSVQETLLRHWAVERNLSVNAYIADESFVREDLKRFFERLKAFLSDVNEALGTSAPIWDAKKAQGKVEFDLNPNWLYSLPQVIAEGLEKFPQPLWLTDHERDELLQTTADILMSNGTPDEIKKQLSISDETYERLLKLIADANIVGRDAATIRQEMVAGMLGISLADLKALEHGLDHAEEGAVAVVTGEQNA